VITCRKLSSSKKLKSIYNYHSYSATALISLAWKVASTNNTVGIKSELYSWCTARRTETCDPNLKRRDRRRRDMIPLAQIPLSSFYGLCLVVIRIFPRKLSTSGCGEKVHQATRSKYDWPLRDWSLFVIKEINLNRVFLLH